MVNGWSMWLVFCRSSSLDWIKDRNRTEPNCKRPDHRLRLHKFWKFSVASCSICWKIEKPKENRSFVLSCVGPYSRTFFPNCRSLNHQKRSKIGWDMAKNIFIRNLQYFTVPHLFLQESGHSSEIPVESTGIPRNSSGILQESSHSRGIPVDSCGIPLEFHWNKNGIKQTKVEILIYLSQFLKLCRYIHFCLSLPFLHHVYSSTLPLKFNFK